MKNKRQGDRIRNEFHNICEHSAKTVHPECNVSIDYEEFYPATVNDAKAVDKVKEILCRFIGEVDLFVDHEPLLGSEDFSKMLQKVPGVMMLLGVTGRERDMSSVPYLHNPGFDINEESLTFGVRVLSEIAFNY